MGEVDLKQRPSRAALVAQPEPGLAPATAIARAEALMPLLREQQDEADAQGHYTAAVHRALLEGGLYRVVQPRLFGGYEFDFTTLLRIVTRIARGHSSSSWCYCLSTSHALVAAAHWSEEAQRDFFLPDGDFRAPHRAAPAGTFRRVDGGWIVDGVWSYSSGIPYATHFAGGAMLPRPGAKPLGVNFIVPRKDVTVLPDWGGDTALGMQGSGSNSVKLENVFVPDHHIAPGDILFGQDIDYAVGTPGTRLHGNPMYLGVVGGIYHLTFSAMMAGTARAALDEYEEAIRTRKSFSYAATRLFEDADTHRTLGEVLTQIQCAEAILWGAAEIAESQLERWGRTGQPITTEDTMTLWAMGRQSSFLSCQAVETMFHTATPRSAGRGQRLQRYFRDVQMFRIHPSAQNWVPEAFGQARLRRPLARYEARR